MAKEISLLVRNRYTGAYTLLSKTQHDSTIFGFKFDGKYIWMINGNNEKTARVNKDFTNTGITHEYVENQLIGKAVWVDRSGNARTEVYITESSS